MSTEEIGPPRLLRAYYTNKSIFFTYNVVEHMMNSIISDVIDQSKRHLTEWLETPILLL